MLRVRQTIEHSTLSKVYWSNGKMIHMLFMTTGLNTRQNTLPRVIMSV